MKTGIELITEERNEHLSKHGRTIEMDVKLNGKMELSFGAAILSCPDPSKFGSPENIFSCPEGWNPSIWMKMIQKPYKERLVIAGSLLAAEIDRIQAK
jgi:hypothetical protein